jgi:hypothetical protein
VGCVENGAVPLVGQLKGESAGVFFSPVFLGLMGPLVQGGALESSHQKACLRVVVGSFRPQGKLQLRSMISLKVVRYVAVFARQQRSRSTATTLTGQLFLQ